MRSGPEIIADVVETVTVRRKGYGSPRKNFADIAAGWSVIFQDGVTPQKVALAMDWLKTCRLLSDPDHEDSLLDKMGYAVCYADCGPTLGDDLAEALTEVLEELTQKPNASAKNGAVDGAKEIDPADPAPEGWSSEAAALARVEALRQGTLRDTADPSWLDTPMPPYMDFGTCGPCPTPVYCKTRLECGLALPDRLELSRDCP